MIERNPDPPRHVEPDPRDPLGDRALILVRRYDLIQGASGIRKIGRRSPSGRARLHNENIIEIFERSRAGTQVVLV